MCVFLSARKKLSTIAAKENLPWFAVSGFETKSVLFTFVDGWTVIFFVRKLLVGVCCFAMWCVIFDVHFICTLGIGHSITVSTTHTQKTIAIHTCTN